MRTRTSARRKNPQTGLYYPSVVPLSAIRRFARQIVERFRPDKIILFGSYAYGRPTPDSDVDLLVIMPTRNQVEQAVRIDLAVEERGFPLDLIVRTPKTLESRLRWGDHLLKEIMTRGKVLYEKDHRAVGTQSRTRHRRNQAPIQTQPAPLTRGMKGVTRYAVEYRYPGLHTTSRQAHSTYQKALVVRDEIRRRLGLRTKSL